MADTAITLPEYDQWSGTPEWRACLLEHGELRANYRQLSTTDLRRVEGCPGCAARLLLPVIHNAWTTGDDATRAALWALQDGYGEPGYMPAQGYDWSGIRDSSPAAIARMAQAVAA